MQDDPSLVEAAVADLQAVVERDPACETFVQPLLFFKGFQVRALRRPARLLRAALARVDTAANAAPRTAACCRGAHSQGHPQQCDWGPLPALCRPSRRTV